MEKINSTKLPLIFACLLFSLGMFILCGWDLHSQFMVRLFPEFIAMVPNTALCFSIFSILILIEETHTFYNLKVFLSSFILIVSLICFIENFINLPFNIDNLFFSSPWFDDTNPFPGRMAPNTAIDFILSVTVLNLIPYGNKKNMVWIIQILNFLIFIIALVGILVYSLKLEFIFRSYIYTRMALHTAVGFIIISFALWGIYRKHDWYIKFYENYPERKIEIVIGAFLISSSLIAGLGVMSVIAYKNVTATEELLKNILNDKANVLVYVIKRAISDIDHTVKDPEILASVNGNANINKQLIIQRMNYLIGRGFTNLVVTDSANHIVYQNGVKTLNPDLILPLKYPFQSKLAWKDGFIFELIAPLKDLKTKNILGYLYAEKKLDFFTQIYQKYQSLGQSGEILLCGILNNSYYSCFPSRLTPHRFIVTSTYSGLPSVMSFAIHNISGTGNSIDYRHYHVITSYTPLNHSGLGMITKMDTLEVYKPLKEDLMTAMLLSLSLALFGLLLLRWQIAPLVLRIINSQKEIVLASKKLRESEERYEAAIINSNTGLWAWEVGSKEMFISPQCKKLLGYTDEELSNEVITFQNILHPDDRQLVADLVEKNIKSGVPYNVEYRLQTRSGEYHWFHSIGNGIRDASGRVLRMTGTLIDINERKKNEERLAMQYKLAKLLAESDTFEHCGHELIKILRNGFNWSHGIIWIIDETGTQLIPIASSHSKRSHEELRPLPIGQGLPGMVWSSQSPIWIDDLSVIKNIPLNLHDKQVQICSIFGFPINWQEEVLGVIEFYSGERKSSNDDAIKISRVISHQIAQFIQRSRVTAKLRQNETYLSAVLESASDSIVTFDYTGKILSYNTQTLKLFNHYAADILNSYISELIPDLTPEKITEIVNQQAVEFMIYQFGRPVTIEITISSMALNEKLILVAVTRDISERKKAEILKNEFITTVSHELRTPITAILGSLGLLESGALGTMSTDALRMLEIANKNCNRLLNLINDILDLKKMEAGQFDFSFKIVDINQLITDAVHINHSFGKKHNVEILHELENKPLFVEVDPNRMMQVLTNLISNAVKFSHAGDNVLVKLQRVDNHAHIEVVDHGIGIPDEFKDKIFLKFTQASNSASNRISGTGLGLNITKAVVERMNGSIGFKSNLNEGTIFYVDLPLVEEKILTEA